MKKKLIAIAIISLVTIGNTSAQSNVESQEYKMALGVKFYPGAVTFKYFLNQKGAVEAIGYIWNRGTRLTGLYEFHFDINSVPGLKWYVGPGVHVGFYNNRYLHDGKKYDGGAFAGVDGIIGLDYKFKGAPINISLDAQPSIDFGNDYGNAFNTFGGIAIRYVFK